MAPQRTATEQCKAAAASGDGQAARTRAAATAQQEEEQQLAAADLAWPLLLQHDSITAWLPLVCKLLCCSKALAAAVAEHCAGQLDVWQFDTAAEAQQAARWLRKHARLVRSLDLRSFHKAPLLDHAAAALVAAALDAIVAALMAAGPQTLALQSLKAKVTPTTLPLLEQLPASHLTELDLSMYERPVQPPDWPAYVARVSAALGRLTALRRLVLLRRVQADDAAASMPGLSALTQLTKLSFYAPVSDLQHVQPQLLELELQLLPNSHEQPLDEQQPLDLRHLTAATALSIPLGFVREGDVLPPNLLRLHLEECWSVQPLLPLVQLQELDVRHCAPLGEITADQLRQLSRLTALGLDYHLQQGAEPASAAAWPLLPLRRLKVKWAQLSAPVCQHLAQLSGLTSLALRQSRPRSAQQLAAALRPLSGLQRLELAEPLGWVPEDAPTQEQEEAAAGMRQVLQVMGSLQQLRELQCWSWPDWPAAAGANSSSLTALTALTRLSLAQCYLTDAAVTGVVSQLPGLQRLDCSCNAELTDAALPAIGRLQQLTALVLCHTQVSDAGAQHLSGLTRLKHLDVYDTRVTDVGVRQLIDMFNKLSP